MLTAARLRELLHYEPTTGVFTRLVTTSHNARAGDIAGTTLKVRGRRMIGVDGGRYYANRLAWLYMKGEWPSNKVDHHDGNKLNDRFDNLRDVTQAVNLQNQRAARSNSLTGFLGVTRERTKFGARIRTNGRTIRIGQFDTPDEAHAAYVAAKRQLHEGNTL